MSSGTNAGRCVYTTPQGLCDGSEDFSEEDYLPRGLGKFKGYQRLKNKICRSCNHRLGDLDNLLLTSGPEAIFRAIYGIEGRRKHRERDVFHETTHGRPPIEVLARLPGDDTPTRLEILEGNLGQPRRELIFEWTNGRSETVPVPRHVDTPEKLKAHLQRKGVEPGWNKCAVYCPEDSSSFWEMIEGCIGRIERVGTRPDLSKYPSEVPAGTLLQLSPEYHRAVAKIGFHFFLWCSFSGISGFEPEFDNIKRFIWHGEDPSHFVLSNAGPFERDQIGDAPYAHLLSAGVANNEARAVVQLFAGSDSGMNLVAGAADGRSFPIQLRDMSFLRVVKLGRSPFRIERGLRRALMFVAYKEDVEGFVGEIRELTPARHVLIWRPGVGPRFWA